MVLAFVSAVGRPGRPETMGLLEGVDEPTKAAISAVDVGWRCRILLRFISALTWLAGTAVMAVNLYVIIECAQPLRTYAIRGYAVLLGGLVVLGEAGRPAVVLDAVKFLECWPAKGLFLGFLGVLTLDADGSSLLQSIAALFVSATGAAYALLGLTCLRPRTADADNDTESIFDSLDLANAPDWLDPSKDSSSSSSI